ncbi:hypothetical protein Hanom_Chr14g01295951 [Helianthus anomalus]
MDLTSRMKMTRFQTFWIQVRKNKPLDESRKTSQTSGTKMTFTLKRTYLVLHSCGQSQNIHMSLHVHQKSKKNTFI